jgi:spore maturation protein CgeB
MKIVILGLSITSSWGNGHATTYRGLVRALRRRGHRIVFFERNVEWYASNRDLLDADFCQLRLYDHWDSVKVSVRDELRDTDVAMVGSYFPDGLLANEEVLASRAVVKAFYDIDTPITITNLLAGQTEYIRAEQIPQFDVYFSFTGGPMLQELKSRFGVAHAVPLYCSVDADMYRRTERSPEFACDLSYMGTYAPDRQSKVEELFCEPARALPQRAFVLAGAQYPDNVAWPYNVRRLVHVAPGRHPQFYSSSRFTLNLARRAMVETGYSPSVRLFEAAACGTTIISDNWPGLDELFTEREQILLPHNANDIASYLQDMDEAEIQRIGHNARERVLAEHTAEKRAIEFEEAIERQMRRTAVVATQTGLSTVSN